jgi:phage terminase small subunit
MKEKLTLKMRTFCLAYAGEANGNATEAARIAGYKGNEDTLRVVASENLAKPNIQAEIKRLRKSTEQKLGKRIMTAAEVQAELSEIAMTPWRDLVEVRYGSEGEVVGARLKLADKIKACELMGKKYKLFTDKVEHAFTPDQVAKETLAELTDPSGKYKLPPEAAKTIVSDLFGADVEHGQIG